ncbi:MAG: FtsW/RodA/SpoVE family cell cycle protein, partial [Clostridia bacterium]|nr:FtsW/RodA/SpoVE family cell cycle protein [Clostridia bacterium]
FIFATIGEELGFLGSLAVLVLLAAIALRILAVGRLSHKKSGTLICVGLFSMLLVHIIINIGMCISVLPVIGITLPFFSAGGSSMLCLYLGIGLILSVYNYRNSRTIYLRDSY